VGNRVPKTGAAGPGRGGGLRQARVSSGPHDAEGRYAFRTIMPGLYPGRTRHYHVKVQAPNRPVLTTQFYFPDEKANRTDAFFHPELVMQIASAAEVLRARFDVVLAMK
jgi:protocatechuate 3,4-dioxygenase beta subunit